MALVKLPSPSPLALWPWQGRGGGCCLWFRFFVLLGFFFNSGIRELWILANAPCARPPLIPSLVPHSP